MAEPENKEKRHFSIEDAREAGKAYGVIVATALTFIGLMFATTTISLYFIGQSLDPNVVATVAAMSGKHLTTTGWQFISAFVIGVNAIVSYLAYQIFKKWFRIHNQNLARQEKFKIKLWPIASMGFVIAGAVGVLEAMITVTNTSLHGLDPQSIYQALSSGSIYGIIAVLVALPVLGIIIVYLGKKTYEYVEGWEQRHKLPDLPEHLRKEKPEDKSKQ